MTRARTLNPTTRLDRVGYNDAADQNDYSQSSTDIGKGTQHCARAVLV